MLTEKDYAQSAELLKSKKLFVFDMDGTIYLGGQPFDFAVRYINKLRENGKRVLFFTNNASHDPVFYLEKLTRLGFDPKPEEICTSGNVTAAFLQRKRAGKAVYLLGTPELYRQFKSYGIDMVCDEHGKPDGRNADIVVTSCDFIRYGAEFLYTHPDYNCPTETGFIPDSGAIAACVTASTGVEPTYFGKPYPETVEMISEITGEAKADMLIYGDRLYTDIATGKRHGITAVLVLTGETKIGDALKADECDQPDIMLPSLAVANGMMFGE